AAASSFLPSTCKTVFRYPRKSPLGRALLRRCFTSLLGTQSIRFIGVAGAAVTSRSKWHFGGGMLFVRHASCRLKGRTLRDLPSSSRSRRSPPFRGTLRTGGRSAHCLPRRPSASSPAPAAPATGPSSAGIRRPNTAPARRSPRARAPAWCAGGRPEHHRRRRSARQPEALVGDAVHQGLRQPLGLTAEDRRHHVRSCWGGAPAPPPGGGRGAPNR